jgi:hypothetical protein
MRRKGAGFFGVIEREHVANYSVSTILYEPQKKLSENTYWRKSIMFCLNIQSLFVQLHKNWGFYLEGF